MSKAKAKAIGAPGRTAKSGETITALGETPRGDPRPKVGKLATPSNSSKVAMAAKGKLPGRDATRQDMSRQIAAMKAEIDKNLRRIVSLTRRGEIDHAALVCAIVADKRSRILELAAKYEAIKNAPIEDEPPAMPRKSPFGVQVKVKRYKTWSDK